MSKEQLTKEQQVRALREARHKRSTTVVKVKDAAGPGPTLREVEALQAEVKRLKQELANRPPPAAPMWPQGLQKIKTPPPSEREIVQRVVNPPKPKRKATKRWATKPKSSGATRRSTRGSAAKRSRPAATGASRKGSR